MKVPNRLTMNRQPKMANLLSLLVVASLLLALPGCDMIGAVTKSVDDVIAEIEKTRETIEGESTAWRGELPKLVNSLEGMESAIAGDAKAIVSQTTNQLADLSSQTIKMSDAVAQQLIAQAGVEFRCNAGFVKAGVVAELNSIIENLQFWKQNKTSQNKKPPHAVCWITPSALSLYQSGTSWLIDNANMTDKNIVKVFGYSFWDTALPKLELQDAGGHKLRDVNLKAAYVTHYQINLDFSNEKFTDAKTGYRVVFRWPDKPDPNSINLTLESPSKLKISSPSWLPAAPREGLDPVTLKVTIKNEGGTRISGYTVQWKPDPAADSSKVFSVAQEALEPGQSRQASLGPYTYRRGSAAPIPGVVLLTNGDDSLPVNIPVKANPTPTPVPVPPSNYYEIKVVTGDRMYAGTDANIYITLFGSLGTCQEVEATGSFERADTDYTIVTCSKNIGNIVKIRVRHDDSGIASGWYLADVRVTNRDTGVYWVFHAHRWLATDENDGRIDVEFWPG